MKIFVSILILCVIPSMALAKGEEKVLTALDSIRSALDSEMPEESVVPTLSGLIDEAKKVISKYKAKKGLKIPFKENAEKALDYYENILRTIKLGSSPFEADRKQADKHLNEAHKVAREMKSS